MKMNIKKLVVGTSIVGVMAMASGCASMGMCGGSKCGSSDKKSSTSKCGGCHQEPSRPTCQTTGADDPITASWS